MTGEGFIKRKLTAALDAVVGVVFCSDATPDGWTPPQLRLTDMYEDAVRRALRGDTEKYYALMTTDPEQMEITVADFFDRGEHQLLKDMLTNPHTRGAWESNTSTLLHNVRSMFGIPQPEAREPS